MAFEITVDDRKIGTSVKYFSCRLRFVDLFAKLKKVAHAMSDCKLMCRDYVVVVFAEQSNLEIIRCKFPR